MRISIPRVHGDTPREKLVRTLALLLVFAIVVWAFTKNNERVIQVLNREGAVYDETKILDSEHRKFIRSFTSAMKKEYGLNSQIQVFGGDFVVPELDAKTLYIGLSPVTGEVRIRFPGLMRHALGEDFAETLTTEHLQPALQGDDWPQELEIVLALIYKRLEKMNKEGGSGE
ncbi:hypothetical protein [Pseudodesulfovibrio sp.]|uniref:hypothetical protein n=1 Tax=unclassified Pseudodesulfovibrio TaxID=2661612 RepID=UPI003AFFA1BA